MTEPTELLPCPFCGGDARNDAHADDCYFILHRKLKNSNADMSPALEVLAAWNRRSSPVVAGEPVAWWIPKAEQFCLADKSGDRPFAKAWEPLYTTPQPTHAQAGAVPLTDAQIESLLWTYGYDTDDERMVAMLKEAHGIKGGQHGTNT